MKTSLGPSTIGPTSRLDLPQNEQVVTRRPRNPPGGRLFGLLGGGGVPIPPPPPPLPGRLLLAIESCLPSLTYRTTPGGDLTYQPPRAWCARWSQAYRSNVAESVPARPRPMRFRREAGRRTAFTRILPD